jgi:hypothetical protein
MHFWKKHGSKWGKDLFSYGHLRRIIEPAAFMKSMASAGMAQNGSANSTVLWKYGM